MATVSEVQTRALRRLGVLARGQTARAEDESEMSEAYAELYSMLDKKSLAVWGDVDDEVPDEYVDPIASLLAFSRVDEYSVPVQRYQRLAAKDALALPKLRDLIADVVEQPTAEYM